MSYLSCARGTAFTHTRASLLCMWQVGILAVTMGFRDYMQRNGGRLSDVDEA